MRVEPAAPDSRPAPSDAQVRNKLAGKLGVLSLDYRVADGTYSDKPDNLERLKLQQEAERRQQSEERWSHAVSEGAEAGGEQPLQQSSSPAAAGKQLRSNAQRPPVAGR